MEYYDLSLPVPPGFRGMHPDLPVVAYHRNLPHWRQDGATYFVTFRTVDSIPQDQVRALKRWREVWERQHPEPRSEAEWQAFAKEITHRTEICLDEGHGHCVYSDPNCARVVGESLLRFQNRRYVTFCFVVMPNHVHVVIRPKEGFKLEVLLRGIKSYSARRANIVSQSSYGCWSRESFDRIVRDEEHLWRVVQYIGRNPGKARIDRDRWFRWIHEDWKAAGWDFRDIP